LVLPYPWELSYPCELISPVKKRTRKVVKKTAVRKPAQRHPNADLQPAKSSLKKDLTGSPAIERHVRFALVETDSTAPESAPTPSTSGSDRRRAHLAVITDFKELIEDTDVIPSPIVFNESQAAVNGSRILKDTGSFLICYCG